MKIPHRWIVTLALSMPASSLALIANAEEPLEPGVRVRDDVSRVPLVKEAKQKANGAELLPSREPPAPEQPGNDESANDLPLQPPPPTPSAPAAPPVIGETDVVGQPQQ